MRKEEAAENADIKQHSQQQLEKGCQREKIGTQFLFFLFPATASDGIIIIHNVIESI